MEISILFTLLLIMILLGGAFFQGGKIYLVDEQQIKDSVIIKYDLTNSFSHWAVKFVLRGLYLLNIITVSNAQKAVQTTLIQPQNLKFEG